MKTKLLLLHGALGSEAQFDSIKHSLATSFEVYSMNFDGHGGKEIPMEYSIDLFVENVLSYLNENQIDSIDIFGYSMGGYVALKLASENPERVKKIVTLGTKFNWNPESAAKEVKMLNPEKIEQKVPQFAQKLSEIHPPSDWKEVVSGTAEMMSGLGNGKKMQDEEFEKIMNQVTIGVGSLDKMVSIDESKGAVSLMPNARMKILEEVLHPIDQISSNLVFDYIRSEI